MIKKNFAVTEDMNEQLKKMPNQSRFIREAIKQALRKRRFQVSLGCATDKGLYQATSYINVKAFNFDGDLKEQVRNHVLTLNSLEQRKGCVWYFDSLSEKE